MNRFDIDYETRSPLDIKDVGAFAYIEHPDARILLAAVSKNGGPVLIWDCFASDEENAPALAIIKEMMSDPDAEIWAHNVMFEIAATNARLFKDLGIWPCTLDKWRCTAALCRVAGFPSSLENASNALFPGTTQVKDTKGKDLIKAFCCPQADGSFLNPYALTTPVWTAKRLTAAQPELPVALFEAIAAKAPEPDLLQLVDGAFEGPKRPTIARLRQVLAKAMAYVADATAHLAGVKVGGELVPHAKAWQMFREYCMQDVKVQAAIWKKLSPEFAPKGVMLESFLAGLDIGVRGFPVNVSAIKNAMAILETDADRLESQFSEITGGLAPTQREKLLSWAQTRGYKGDNMTAATVDDELARLEDESHDSDIVKALTIRSKLSFAALKKLPKMLEMGESSGRVRNGFTWYGARTGRDSATDVQPQNIKRPGKYSDVTYDAVCAGATCDEFISQGLWESIPDMLDPHEAIALCARHFIQEPDRDMTSIDFASVEARICPWLVGQEDKLNMHRNPDMDVYCWIAANLGIFNITYEELYARYKAGDKEAADIRQVGKVAELACQFMGTEPAIESFAKIYRVKIPPEHRTKIKNGYRSSNPMTVKAWAAIGRCALAAVAEPGSVHTHLRLSFQMLTIAGIPYLTMILPSGRKLYYPKPKAVWMRMRFVNGKKVGKPHVLDHEPSKDELEVLRTLNPADRKVVDSEAAMAYARGEDYRPSIYYMIKPQLVFWGQHEKVWGDVATHGGKLLENAVQGTAGCFFHYAVPRLIKAGFRITMTVHDEVVGPVDPGHDAKKLEALMAENPPWALDFPLAAKASTDRYYTK